MHIIFCKKLSMIIIFFSIISDIFHSFFQFCPVSSSFVRTKLEEIGFFHFFPGVPEEIGFFRKKPNPGLLHLVTVYVIGSNKVYLNLKQIRGLRY